MELHFETLSDVLFSVINETRMERGFMDLVSGLDVDFRHVTCQQIEFSDYLEEHAPNAEIEEVEHHKQELENRITQQIKAIAAEEEDSPMKAVLLFRNSTHVEVTVSQVGATVTAKCNFYSKHLSLEQVGNFIDGNLLLEGICLQPTMGPALCVVEFAADHDESYHKVSQIHPWEMMYTPAVEEEGAAGKEAAFAIPVRLGPEFHDGAVRITVYVDEASNISFGGPENDDEEPPSIDIALLTSALVISSRVGSEGGAQPLGEDSMFADEVGFGMDGFNQSMGGFEGYEMGTEGEAVDRRFVTDVRIAMDMDEVHQLHDEGYDVSILEVNENGVVKFFEESAIDPETGDMLIPAPEVWKFFFCVKHEDLSMVESEEVVGLEDIAWVRVEKALGTIPLVPLFEVYHDHDLAGHEEAYSVYLAVRKGNNPVFKTISLAYQKTGCDSTLEALLAPTADGTVSVFKLAPDDVSKHFGGVGCAVGVIMTSLYKAERKFPSPKATSKPQSNVDSPASRSRSATHSPRLLETLVDGEIERTVDFDVEDVIAEEPQHHFDENSEEASYLREVTEKIISLEAEIGQRRTATADIERKLAHLLARLAQYSSAAGPRTVNTSEKPDTTTGGEHVVQESAAALMQAQENDAEKEKLYMETMKLITSGRAKLLRQINDYEQLAQDLQTRLDDKELKAVEITNSFNVFKDEILAKAENSRTGMPISKRLIAQFQLTEQKKDEELEKVRLRHISLKQQLKKLEKTLKAREQLAEGLHMIDFEQLKIENQTLNEKIDERNEEFNKLKRKKILTIQVLTHVREKLRFVRKQNAMLRVKIEELDEQINGQRALISVAKKDRDSIKDMNFELKRLQGFAGSDLLLNDFEKRKDDTESIRLAIKELQEKKFLLTQQIRSNNTRIKETLMLQSSQGKVGTFFPPISRK